MHRKNELLPVTITDMTHEGSGVGRLEDGMAVFVPATAVGDRLKVRLVKVNKNSCYGRIEELLAPSSDRISPDCPVNRRCGGCVFRHVSYAAELRYKQRFVQQNLTRIGGFSLECEPILPSPEQSGYRNKAQYAVRPQKDGGLAAGFYAPHSHDLIEASGCLLQPPLFQKLVETVLDYARKNAVTGYDENGGGLLRHIYLRRGARSGETMVCLVANTSTLPGEDKLVEALCACDDSVVSILLNENSRNTNVILGEKTRLLFGKEMIGDRFCGLWFELSAQTFYQVNSLAAELLYALAAEYAELTETKTMLDLYCGAGTIGLSMASRVREVIGVEIVPQAVANAQANARANGISNARFFCADAGEAAVRLEREGVRPDVVVLDPPRKGCDAQTLQAVAAMAPGRIVMISCNSATMARDCAALAALGYLLVRCRPVDLFARTAHVECVCLLQKNSSDEDNC